MKGKKITGFFGFFDILGYKHLNANNELNDLIQIFDELILDVDKEAVTMSGLDKDQRFFPQPKVETLVFSDTIILYQVEPSKHSMIGVPQILYKSSLLLRIAFERGIPIRGAISYGEYYIHKRCYLGKPVIEAYEQEKSQKWSGAILCKSAEEQITTLLKDSNNRSINYRGLDINFKSELKTSLECLLYRYPVPVNNEKIEKLALCWDDSVIDFLGLNNIEELTREKNKKDICRRVKRKFQCHGKCINEDVEKKIDNTVKFLYKSRSRPLTHPRLQYIP